MTADSNTILAIFTNNRSISNVGHCYTAIIENTGNEISVTPLDYHGGPKPPDLNAAPDSLLADGGLLLPISRKAAKRLIQQYQSVADNLNATPKKQDYYYTKNNNKNPTQEAKGRKATDCVSFAFHSITNAGIDLNMIEDGLPATKTPKELLESVARLQSRRANNTSIVENIKGNDSIVYHLSTTKHNTPIIPFSSTSDVKVVNLLKVLEKEQGLAKLFDSHNFFEIIDSPPPHIKGGSHHEKLNNVPQAALTSSFI